MREARYAIDVLLPESEEHDLLVLGTHRNSLASGLLFGSTASEAAHRTERPLLIARAAPGGEPFPKSILIASDGSEGSSKPVHTAAQLAAAFDSEVEVVYVPDGKGKDAESRVEQQLAELAEGTGREPPLLKLEGHAKKAIVEQAEQRGSSLIVAGKRSHRGLKALGSVSERIVGDAHCSVMLIPVID